jgi:hypothetical protein
MTEGKRRLDRILGEGYLSDLAAHTTQEIRIMRTECAEEEALLSYERRLIHGRLAILAAELKRRTSGEDVSIVDMLPSILADEHTGPSRGSYPGADPNLDFLNPQRRVSKLISDDTLANLPGLDTAEIENASTELRGAEQEVSGLRTEIFKVLDVLNAEIARRYQTGEADPADVLATQLSGAEDEGAPA